MNITANDIATGAHTFDEVHPETCTDIDLRNVKANAFAATNYNPLVRQSERNAANTAMCDLVKEIGEREDWSEDEVLHVAVTALNWGIGVNKEAEASK